MSNFDYEQSAIEQLILQGALEVSGIDIETGEPLYNFTDKLKDVNPELHNEYSMYFTRETMALWEHGFLDINLTDANPVVRLTEKAFNTDEIAKMDKDRQYTLKEIIRIILQEE